MAERIMIGVEKIEVEFSIKKKKEKEIKWNFQHTNHVGYSCIWCDSYAFGCHFLTTVLEIKAHHTMELQILYENRWINKETHTQLD